MTWLWNVLSQFFRWLASRNEAFATPQGQDDAARAKKGADAAAMDAKVGKMQKAVVKGDEDEVNKTLRDLGFLLVLVVMMSGCATRPVVYINTDDKAVRMERDGKPGWWLSDAVFAQLLEKAMRQPEKKP